MLNLFKATPFATLIESLDLRVVDIGARGGMDHGFLPAAWATTAIGFEPEPEECRILNQRPPSPWRSARFVPTAIGGTDGTAMLHLPIHNVGASLLPHNPAMIPRFGHHALHETHRQLPVPTLTLDRACVDFGLGAPDYLKIDVEGAEHDILANGTEALAGCSAVMVETSFLEQRRGQPRTHEVVSLMLEQGFVLADIRDIHRWRRRPLAVHPHLAQSTVPYSRGIAAQCDLLFLREHADSSGIDAMLRLFVVAAVLGYFDHAVGVLRGSPDVAEALRAATRPVDPLAAVADVSRRAGLFAARVALAERFRSMVPLLRSLSTGIAADPRSVAEY